MCPDCGRAIAECVCAALKVEAIPAGDGIVRISRQTKGRKGKVVTLITGVPVNENELRRLAKQLKRKCGAGGTVKDGVIEIQGEYGDTLLDELNKQGYCVKRAGG